MHELRDAGERIDDPLAPYRRIGRQARAGRPWVLANMVAGLDGTAAVGGKVAALSSPTDSRLFTRLRGLADVVLVGARTVRQERYGPVVLDDDLVDARRAEGRPGTPRLALVSASLDFDPDLPIFTRATPDALPIVVTSARSDTARLRDLPVEVVVAGDVRVDLPTALGALGALGGDIVLCEGGPTLLGELIGAGLLDEYCLTLAPRVGGDPLPIVDTSSLTGMTEFSLNHVYVEEDTLFLNYLRERAS